MFILNRIDRKNKKMKPSYTDFDRVKCIASTENQKHCRKPIRIAQVDYVTVGTRNRTTSNHREYSVSSTLCTC